MPATEAYKPQENDSRANVLPFENSLSTHTKSTVTFDLADVIRYALAGFDLGHKVISCLDGRSQAAIEQLDGDPSITHELLLCGSPDPTLRSTDPAVKFTVSWTDPDCPVTWEKLSGGKEHDGLHAS